MNDGVLVLLVIVALVLAYFAGRYDGKEAAKPDK